VRNNPYNNWATWGDDDPKPTITPKNRWAGWAALLRLPNLFTVPGDAMAGLTVAALMAGRDLPMTWYLLAIGGAALCFYVFGLLVNDLADFNEDALMRPERPLPAGLVLPGMVISVMLLLPMAGLGLAWLVSTKALGVAIILLPLVVMYNLLSKHVTVLACVNMGACRAVAFLLGVAPTEWLGIPGLLALAWGAYIALVTLVARGDEQTAEFGSTAWWLVIPSVALAGGVNALAWYLPGVPPPLRNVGVPLLTLAFLLGVVFAARRLRGRVVPAQNRAVIGDWLRCLIPLQAACLFLSPRTVGLAVVVLCGWPLSIYFGRRYSAS
jgi:hypothetical protein